jgi:Cytochrome c554 and c-prime
MPLPNSIGGFWFWRGRKALRGAARLFTSLAAVFFCATTAVRGQSVQHLTTIQPGGLPGLPVLGGIEQWTNGVRLNWDGPSGYYQVFQKSNSLSAPWMTLGSATNLVRYAVITKLYRNAFFRVAGPPPRYAGAKACTTCHSSICRYETNTFHAAAFSSPAFAAQGGQTNSLCLPCHTVGYGLPTGFNFTNAGGALSYAANLAGVQCENCHGPAASHAAAPDDPAFVPQVEIAATLCGGCHSAGPVAHTNNAPTFEEWSASGHAVVVPTALRNMSSDTNDIRECGACHSGSARLTLIGGTDPAVTLTQDYDVAVTCAVCHDPHATNANPAQLRGPVNSTNYFALTTNDVASVAAFTNAYAAGADVNLCAQCHNDRGAAWTDTARAPHHSLQYNFLLGSVGELPGGSAAFNPGPHAGLPSSAVYSVSGTFYLTNQCVACHMPSDAAPLTTHSHALAVSDDVCLNCHDPQAAEADLTTTLSNQVATVIFALNQWADYQAPAAARTNGAVAWEYPSADGLAWQTNTAGQVTGWALSGQIPGNFNGPAAEFQSSLTNYPDILKARFDLYLVLNDGSFGVHNPGLASSLLNAAEFFVLQQLYN